MISKDDMCVRNVLSEEKYSRQKFQFDLQLFGHESNGKGVGKAIFTIGLAAFGYFNATAFGFASNMSIGGALLGASLASTVWSATHKEGEHGSPSVQRFDRAQETMSSDGLIPIVYGLRKVVGNQTFHQADAEANMLHKHVVLCEGGIEGIMSVTANDLLIPTGTQNAGVVFTVQNLKDPEAKINLKDKLLTLSANGQNNSVQLCNRNDASNDGSYYEWQVNITSLVSYINRLGNGWQAFPTASTSSYPGDLRIDNPGSCYKNPVSFSTDTVKGGSNYTFHDCEAPDNYNDVGGYPGLAWLDMNFTTSSELNGNPSVAAVIKGEKVFDMRTGETAYSTNPALCLRDFILSKRYGLGKWISSENLDNDSWIEAADYCDEIIKFHNSDNVIVEAKRYELNMIIDQSNSAISWIQEILANFCGYLTLAQGKFKLKIEKKEPIVYKFNDDNCSDLSISPLKLSETPNKYSVSIIDPGNNWQAVPCLCEDFSDQKVRGKVVPKEVQLNGVTSQNQALRLARFYRDYNLSCPLQVSFKTGYQAMHLEPGDVVTVSFHDVFSELPIRISEIVESEEHEFTIKGRQYNPDLYNDDLGGGIGWYNYTTTNSSKDISSQEPRQVSKLSAITRYRSQADGRTEYSIHISFELPVRYDVESAVIYYRMNYATAEEIGTFPSGVPSSEVGYSIDWKVAGESSGDFIIPNVNLGDTYEIMVRSKTTKGIMSSKDNAPTCTVAVSEKKTVPSQPNNLSYDFSEKFLFKWNDVPDSDVVYYEIRSDQEAGSPSGLLGRTPNTSLAVSLTNRYGRVYVYAINSQKQASYPATIIYSYPAPKPPSSLTITEAPRGVNITAPPMPSGCSRIAFYISSTKYSRRIVQDNTYFLFTNDPGIYDVQAAYIDLMGEGDMSAKFTAVINPVLNPEWIQDESISLSKMDAATKKAFSDLQDTSSQLSQIKENISEIVKTNSSIVATVADVKANSASQVKQLSNQIDFAVANSKEGVASDIKQTADSITQIVSDLNNADPSKSKYAVITQLADGINLKVSKDDIVNQINMTSSGVTIDGRYLHITGLTKFDNDIISEGMIKAGAITADKLAAGSISADSLNVKELSALSAKIGLLRTKDSGSRVEISDNLIKVYDDNNILRVKLGVW